VHFGGDWQCSMFCTGEFFHKERKSNGTVKYFWKKLSIKKYLIAL
jgi:hypothetical protein